MLIVAPHAASGCPAGHPEAVCGHQVKGRGALSGVRSARQGPRIFFPFVAPENKK